MKNILNTLVRERLKSVGMDASKENIRRLLNHVVEKAGVKTYLKSMTDDEIFAAAKPEKKEEKSNA